MSRMKWNAATFLSPRHPPDRLIPPRGASFLSLDGDMYLSQCIRENWLGEERAEKKNVDRAA